MRVFDRQADRQTDRLTNRQKEREYESAILGMETKRQISSAESQKSDAINDCWKILVGKYGKDDIHNSERNRTWAGIKIVVKCASYLFMSYDLRDKRNACFCCLIETLHGG